MEALPRPDGRKEWFGLAVLALPTLLVSMDISILYLATPALSADLRPSGAELLWISDIYGFLLAGALIPMGAVGDRIGRRRLLLIGAAFFGAASLLAASATSTGALIAARAILGIAGATLLPSTLALIRNMFHDPRQRGTAIGIWTTCFTLGGVMGPIVGGYLLEHFWWGSVFLVGLPALGLLLLLGPFLLPEFREADRHPIDPLSVAQVMVAVLATTYAIKHAAESGVTAMAVALLAIGLIAGAAFVRRQKRVPLPLMDLSLFENATFSAALGANALALFAWAGASLLVAQYLPLILGLSPMAAGLWTVPAAAGSVVGCLAAPALAQRVAPARVIGAGLLLAALGLGTLAVLAEASGLGAIVAGMVLLGLGVAAVVTLATDLVLTAVPPARAGAAAALSETGAELGASLGVALLGSLGLAIYRAALAATPGLNPAQVASGRDTLGAALDLAREFPVAAGTAFRLAAQSAFTQAFGIVLAAGCVLMFAMTLLFLFTARRRIAPTAARHGDVR